MKKIYNSPRAKCINLSAEGNLLSLSLTGSDGGNNPGVSESGGVDQGEELTRQQGNSLWDNWND